MTKDEALVATLRQDYTRARLEVPDRRMLTYAEKLTKTPAAVAQRDIDALREIGFSDAAILDIAQVTAYYGFVNRIASGLGVELESTRSTSTAD